MCFSVVWGHYIYSALEKNWNRIGQFLLGSRGQEVKFLPSAIGDPGSRPSPGTWLQAPCTRHPDKCLSLKKKTRNFKPGTTIFLASVELMNRSETLSSAIVCTCMFNANLQFCARACGCPVKCMLFWDAVRWLSLLSQRHSIPPNPNDELLFCSVFCPLITFLYFCYQTNSLRKETAPPQEKDASLVSSTRDTT